MIEIKLSDEHYKLTLECLKGFKEMMFMITKMPIKKAKKIEGNKFINVIDELILIFERKGI